MKMKEPLFRTSRRDVLRTGLSVAATSLLPHSAAVALGAPFADTSIHVAPNGNDSNPGSAARPLATLPAALARLGKRKLQGASIVLHSGVFEMTSGALVTGDHSGSTANPTVVRAAEGATPILTAARRIAANDFKPVTNAATLARIAPSLRGRIVELDLAALGLEHIHKYPDVFNDNGGIIELFVDERRAPLARYPKQGYMQIKEVVVNGGGMETAGDWRSFYQNGAIDQHTPRNGMFVYRDDRTARWISALDRGVWIKGYWRVPWQNEAVRIAAIDPSVKTITLAAPIPGGIGNKYHRPKGSGEENYWLINLLEELTAPGEWCIDFTDKKLYFYPPAPLDKLDIRIADNNAPVLHLSAADHVRLEGLTISGSRVDGVVVTGGTGSCIAGCTVRNTTQYGVRLAGGYGNEVVSSDVYATGAGGIWLGGGNETSTPRQPAGHRVTNNHIHHFGEIERVYAPGINAGFTGGGGGGHHEAVGMIVANNLIHDGPHAGILHGSWDHVFEYNEIFRVCKVSNDMGHFYCFDDYHRSGNRTFRYNFMHNSPLADGIYFDRDNREDKLYGNLVHIAGIGFLYKLGNEAVDPLTIFCWNNVAVECTTGFRFAMRKGSDVHDNVAAQCKTPYIFLTGSGGKGPDPEGDVSTGNNLSFANDPGFVNAAGNNFAFAANSPVLQRIKFQQIPWEKIGLFKDEYRRSLPDEAEIRRFANPAEDNGSAYDIRDR